MAPSRPGSVRFAERHQVRQSFALLPRCSDARIRITKPSQSRVKKFIGGRRLPAAALFVKGPAKDELRRTIVLGSHSLGASD